MDSPVTTQSPDAAPLAGRRKAQVLRDGNDSTRSTTAQSLKDAAPLGVRYFTVVWKRVMWLHYILIELKRLMFGVKHTAAVDITDRCNLRCEHCYHFDGKDEFQKDQLPVDVWRNRFRELYQSGIRLLLLVGGEPSLRVDILLLADAMFPSIRVITNGMIKIPEAFHHVLFVSIDGEETTNDSIRGKGTFSKVMHNYSGDTRVVLNMTIYRKNYRELERVVKLAKDNNFRGVVCNLYTPTCGKTSPLFITKEERTFIIEELRRVKFLYPKTFLLTRSMIRWYEFPDHRGYCYWGDGVLHFDASWNARRCFSHHADCAHCGCLAGARQSPFKVPYLWLKG